MRAESGPYRAEDIIRACKGVLVRGEARTSFDAITTDSRDIRKNDLFVPLTGATFDGHDFLLPALEAGARGSLVDREINRDIFQHLHNIVLIQVQNTLHALSDLASAHRSQYPIPLIAVTGSSGKTTVKEMIAAVLRRSHRPLISQGNLNNMIGLPMTVLSLGSQHTAAVVEAGINQPGEMDFLARAAAADVAVITTIGPVHLEGLKSIENVAREKFKLARSLRPEGTAVIPAENEFLEPLAGKVSCRVVTFGIDRGDFRAEDLTLGRQTRFRMIAPVGDQDVTLQIHGRHNVANALAAMAACVAVGVPLSAGAAALREFRPPSLRMEVLTLSGDRTLIRDCYNANPQSMAAALEVLATAGSGSKTLALLADMKELGEQTEKLHSDMGQVAARLDIDRMVFVGDFGASFAEGFLAAGGDSRKLTLAADKETAWNIIEPDLANFGAVLVKGSRAMRMELIADRIVQEG